jgi:hypothetical protein
MGGSPPGKACEGKYLSAGAFFAKNIPVDETNEARQAFGGSGALLEVCGNPERTPCAASRGPAAWSKETVVMTSPFVGHPGRKVRRVRGSRDWCRS